jgi:hypothetical protein
LGWVEADLKIELSGRDHSARMRHSMYGCTVDISRL